MTQTIEQPQAKIAELEAEVERLKRTNSSYANLTKAQESQLTNLRQRLYQLKGADSAIDSKRQANCDLTEQLAAEQLNNKLLREHLRKLIEFELLDAGALSTDELCAEFRQAVIAYNATPISTEALDKYVAEKVKELSDEHRRATLIRYEQTAEIIRQRDLAIEWLERCAAHVRPTATIFYEEIVEAINAIKEGEENK